MTNSSADGQGGITATSRPPVVDREAWNTARADMLVREKAFTRARDAHADVKRGD